jgi:capsular polysaccharide biosynthesis protein
VVSERVEFRAILSAMRRRWWIVVLAMVVAAAAAFGISLAISPVYEARTSILVGAAIDSPDLTTDELDATDHLTLVYADLATRQPVLQGAIDTVGLRTSWTQLLQRVHVDLPSGNTDLMVISADASTRDEARAIAQAISDQLIALSPTGIEQQRSSVLQSRLDSLHQSIVRKQKALQTLHSNLSAATSAGAQTDIRAQIDASEQSLTAAQDRYNSLVASNASSSVNKLTVIERAQALQSPVIPKTKLYVAVAAVLGLLIGAAIAYALEFRGGRTVRAPIAGLGLPEASAGGNGRRIPALEEHPPVPAALEEHAPVPAPPATSEQLASSPAATSEQLGSSPPTDRT